jgi:Replication initiator protein A
MASKDKQVVSLPEGLTHRMLGTDELNICEFPLASAGRIKGDSSNTIFFEDKIFDEGSQQHVERKLIITASQTFGLPTPADNDVLLVLMYLTLVRNGFAERTVKFSRYELVKLLGWDQGGKSYRRIDESLQRWVNVTLNYKRSWWSKSDLSWQNKSFHVLESIDLRGRGNCSDDSESTFSWNPVIFTSVQNSNVKRLDLETYFKLKSPAARQAYRFLDKRFYRSKHLEFDLRSFACEHVGLGRNYDNGKLKHKLRPCLGELEEIGFLTVLTNEERFIKQQRGEWKIRLTRVSGYSTKQCETTEGSTPIDSDLILELIARKVSKTVASELVASYSTERITEKLGYLDWLVREGKSVPKNPAGFLAAAIRNDYKVRTGITKKPSKHGRLASSPQRLTRIATISVPTVTDSNRCPLRDHFDSLPSNVAAAIEAAAIENGNRFKVDTYRRLEVKRDGRWEALRWDLIRSYLESQQGK